MGQSLPFIKNIVFHQQKTRQIIYKIKIIIVIQPKVKIPPKLLMDPIIFNSINKNNLLPEIMSEEVKKLTQRMNEKSMLKQKAKLEQVWNECNIPEFYRNIFLEGLYLNNIKKVRKYAKRQIDSMKDKSSIIIELIKLINIRQNNFQKINNIIKQHNQNFEGFHTLAQTEKKVIQFHQQLTLSIAEDIVTWRNNLLKLYKVDKKNDYHLCFKYNNQNYLLKLIQDSKPLCKFLKLPEQDIFLIGLKNVQILRVRANELMMIQQVLETDKKISKQ